MAIHSQTFVIITNRLIMKCWKKLNVPTRFEKNRTKPGNPYYLVLFENCTKTGTVLSETVLSGDSLYIKVQLYSRIKQILIFSLLKSIKHTNSRMFCARNITLYSSIYENIFWKNQIRSFNRDSTISCCLKKIRSYITFNKDFLKNFKPGRLIEPVRLIEWWEYLLTI